MTKPLERYGIFIVGLYVLTLGVVMIVKASLGTSPISSFTYVLSLHTPLTLGMATILLNILLIFGQFLFIRDRMTRKDTIEILMQLPFSVLFGLFIDFNMWLMSGLQPTEYVYCVVILICGCILQATGVYMEIKPNVVKMSAEGFVNYASLRYNRKFGNIKVIFDLALVAMALVASFLFARQVDGVHEGTLVSAIAVGLLVTLISRLAAHISHR
ncbi:MAG: DUF6198 family protein [Prevotella sp.]|nr:DUF6198 family protein [Prevotella sp.]MCM1074935.1 DUF6198 family protein [Ruminococcus sp.]